MSYTYVIGWVSDINDNTCDNGKRGFPHGDVQSLQADRVRMQAMHWISISHCFVGVFLFFNMIWCSHFFDASKCEHVIQYILGQVYSVNIYWTSMRHPLHALKNCLQESPPQCRFALPVPASRFTSSREMTYDTNTNRNANAKKTHGKTYRVFFSPFALKMTKCLRPLGNSGT